MMMKSKKGFSLIELLIVIAIIGILAALGVPKYKEYTLRAKFADVINATLPVKQALVLCYSTGGTYNGVECDEQLRTVTPGAAVTAGARVTGLRQEAFQRNVASVDVADRTANTASIRSVAETAVFGGAYDYVLNADAIVDGSQRWSIDAGSSCFGAAQVGGVALGEGVAQLRLCQN